MESNPIILTKQDMIVFEKNLYLDVFRDTIEHDQHFRDNYKQMNITDQKKYIYSRMDNNIYISHYGNIFKLQQLEKHIEICQCTKGIKSMFKPGMKLEIKEKQNYSKNTQTNGLQCKEERVEKLNKIFEKQKQRKEHSLQQIRPKIKNKMSSLEEIPDFRKINTTNINMQYDQQQQTTHSGKSQTCVKKQQQYNNNQSNHQNFFQFSSAHSLSSNTPLNSLTQIQSDNNINLDVFESSFTSEIENELDESIHMEGFIFQKKSQQITKKN